MRHLISLLRDRNLPPPSLALLGLNTQAMQVLLAHVGDLDRAQEFADRIGQVCAR